MKKLPGIFATDEVNRYKHKIEFSAFYKEYLKKWNEYVPSFANHDHTKPIGCSKMDGCFIKPGTVYVMGSFYIGENEVEENQIAKYCIEKAYYDQIDENADAFQFLEHKLQNKLSNDYKKIYNGGAYIYDKNIVKKVFPDLYNKVVDGLIDINLLEPIAPGVYRIGEFMICAHPYFRRSFSRFNSLNEPFLKKLQSFRKTTIKTQVALDMDLIGLASTYITMFEYQYWWGPHFTDSLTQIPYGVTIHKNDSNNSLLSPIKQTEFRWYNQDNKHTFECEEIIDCPNINKNNETYYGCRFVHSMVDSQMKSPIHLDGAIRAYTDTTMCKRLETTLDKTDRNTIYTKIWRLDNLLSVTDWKELITHYYRDNMLIGEYFGGIDNQLTIDNANSLNEQQKETERNNYIPLRFSGKDAICFSVSFDNPNTPNKGNDIELIPIRSININDKWIGTLDYMFIPVLKMLKNNTISVDTDNYAYVGCDDYIHNFPHFLCSSATIAQTVLAVLKNFFNNWRNGANEIITFTIEYPACDKNVKLSFIAQKTNLIQLLNSIDTKSLSSDDDGLFIWCNNIYNYITKNFNKPTDVDPISVFMDGRLYYYRKLIPIDNRMIKQDEKGLRILLNLPKEKINYITEGKIGATPLIWYKKIKCQKCSHNYLNCNCILYKDEDVSYTIEDLKIIGWVWYDKNIPLL